MAAPRNPLALIGLADAECIWIVTALREAANTRTDAARAANTPDPDCGRCLLCNGPCESHARIANSLRTFAANLDELANRISAVTP